MKNKKRIFIFTLVLIMFSMFFMNVNGHAEEERISFDEYYSKYVEGQENVIVLKEMKDVPLDKMFKITFNKAVNTYEAGQNITVFRENPDGTVFLNGSHKVSSWDGDNVKEVHPLSLRPNTRYMIWIHSDIKAEDGSILGKDVYMPFTTVDEE